ncbi:MAG: RNA 2',3'-cyclic phosphodiesterase [Armatimonadota bacterium]
MPEIRSFIAVEVDPAIIRRLAEVQAHLRGAGADVSWSRPEGMHLTLKFLGNVAEERIPAIGDALAEVAEHHTPFTVTVAGSGGFPTARRPRVVWAGISDGTTELTALAVDVETTLATLGFPPEERPFRPHLTLGRVKSPGGADKLAALLAEHADDQFGAMQVTEIILMRSELSPKGARYTPLRKAQLRTE